LRLPDGEVAAIKYISSPDDPYSYVISANIHRRHLTGEQRRELIGKLLEANPEKSDRQIGSMAKSDGKTVATVRAEKERRAEIPHVGARIDAKGRKQPARSKPKSAPKPKPKAAVEPPPKERVVADVVAPDEELSLLRDFVKFVLTRANVGGIDRKDYDEWKGLLSRVKAILGGPR
jgi:hypothetical protein